MTKTQNHSSGLRDHFWIGGTNLFNEPYFYWMGNDAPFTFTDWHPNEPNNFHLNEKCVEIWFYKNIYKWNDQSCRTRSYFVCEERISKICFVERLILVGKLHEN